MLVDKLENETQRSDQVLAAAQDHAVLVVRAVREMAQCVEAWTRGDAEEVERKLAVVTKIEEDANVARNKVIKMVAEAQTMLSRTDILRLVLKVDELADYAEGTAVRISRVNYVPRKEIAAQMNLLTESVVKTSKLMRQAVRELLSNPPEALRHCGSLDAAEREVDQVFRQLESDLFEDMAMDVRILLQIRSVAYHLEDMGDVAKAVGDAVRIIALSR
ncbi:MAG: hypothetical protein Kow0069_30900 [Promethearchaeota archaeon]